MLCQQQDHRSDRFSMRSCPERTYILAFFAPPPLSDEDPVILTFFESFVPFRLSSLSMAKAPVTYFLEAVRPATIPPSSYLFIVWVAFRLDFMAGIILHFIFIACVASSCFIAYVAFSCYGMCRLHVGFSRRVSPSS